MFKRFLSMMLTIAVLLTLFAVLSVNVSAYQIDENGVVGITSSDERASVSASYNEKEDNGSYEKANTISLPSTVTGVISKGDDKDYYKISVKESGHIQLRFDHEVMTDSSAIWSIKLIRYTSDGYSQVYNYEMLGTKTGQYSPRMGLSSGTYFILVEPVYKDFSSDRVNGITYTMNTTFTATSDWETEDNNDYNKANAITLGKTYGGFLNSGNDKDYYKFTAPANGYTTFKFNHDILSDESASWDLRIFKYTDSYTEAYSYEFKASKLSTTPKIGVEKGISYYVVISPVYRDFSAERVTNVEYSMVTSFTASEYWEHEPNNAYNTANHIELNKTYGGFINSGDDKDYYLFEPKARGTVTFKLDHEILADASAYWNMKIIKFNDEYTEVYSYDVPAFKSSITPRFGVSANSVYYVIISPVYKDFSAERVSFIEYSLTTQYQVTERWEIEANNTYSEATPIVANQPYGGFLSSGSDEDYYVFTATKSSKIRFNLDHEILNDNDAYWRVRVYQFKDGYTEICSYDIPAGKTIEDIEIQIEKSLTYYFVVSSVYKNFNSERVSNIEYFLTATDGSVILGDTDGDGKVTILDATTIQRHLANLPTTAYIEAAADADEDGKVTILDATAIQRHLAQLNTNKNIGKIKKQ